MGNNKDILAIWKEHSSQKSILVPWLPEECKEGGPVSIFTLAKEVGLKSIHVVSSNYHNFVELQKNGSKLGIELRFGLELWVTDIVENTPQSTNNESKIIIWLKNSESYKDAIKLYSKVYTNPANKYYHMRSSWAEVKSMWTNNLALSLPFFDSFIARNLLHYGSAIIPDFPCEPVIHREINTGLPFEGLINQALDNFNVNGEYEEIKTKTILYDKYEDAKPMTVYRTISERTNYGAPNLDYFCSDTFCFQDFKNLTK